MFGSEYNWLITLTRPLKGVPRVRLAGNGLLTLAIALFCLLAVVLRAEPPHRQLLREATVAAQAGDTAQLIAKLEAVRALRPDYPRVLYGLVRAYTAAGRADDALAQLRALAAMGLVFDPANDEALVALHERPDFVALTKTFLANRNSVGTDGPPSLLPEVDGIIEGLACDPATRTWYFSDVRNRCIWSREATADVLKKFTSDTDRLTGVFGMKIDGARHALWAGASALPEMKGYTDADKGRAELVEFDLATGRVRQTFAVPIDGNEHVLGDVLVAPDGGVFATDSTAPVIWRLPPGGKQLEKWLEHGDFVSLQGLALGSDGKSLYVADYANGLWRIDLTTRAVGLLGAPANSTLFGIDGIYAVPGGLIAVQNGLNPQRILRLALGPDGQPASARVLRSGHPAMTDVTLGQVVNGRFHFIGNAGWSLYEKPPAAGPAPRTVTILNTSVE